MPSASSSRCVWGGGEGWDEGVCDMMSDTNCSKVKAKYCVRYHVYWRPFSVVREGEATRSLRKSDKSPFVVVLRITRVHWMLTSALSALLPRTRDRSDANLGKRAVSFAAYPVCVFPTYIPRSIREQWTGATPSLVRKLNGYSKVG